MANQSNDKSIEGHESAKKKSLSRIAGSPCQPVFGKREPHFELVLQAKHGNNESKASVQLVTKRLTSPRVKPAERQGGTFDR